MRSSGDRQTRVRLARRRPAPLRVRRPAGRARGGIPWVHVGAVVGAVAAIGGVIFTGVATYYSAQIAGDQLEQSREDAERKERAQANQVSFYMGGGDSSENVHIVNRSADPIRSPIAVFWVEHFTKSGQPLLKRVYYQTGWYGDLAPCSELVFESDDFNPPSIPVARWIKQPEPQILSLTFTDREGKNWHRTPTTLDQQLANDAGRPPRPPGRWGSASARPEVKRVEACGDRLP